MGSIADDVAAAKASFSSNLASAKQDAAITVAEAKSSLLQEFRTSTSPSSPGFIPRMKQEFSDIAVKARKDFLDSMPDPKRVIKTENNIQFLADGTFNLITSTGKILYSVKKDELEDLLRIEEVRAKDLEKQKRLEMKATPMTELGAVGVDVTGKIISGIAEKGSDILNIGTSSQTLTEEVDKYNEVGIRNMGLIGDALMKVAPGLASEPRISKEDLAKYQNTTKKNGRRNRTLSF